MLRLQLPLLFFCLFSSVLSQQKPNITYDRVPIYYENSNMHVLANAFAKPAQSSAPLTKVLLALYTSQTVLTLNCIDFDKFDNCSKASSIDETIIEYTRFTATASETYEAQISLGKEGWNLSTNVLGAQSCSAYKGFNGMNKTAVIGLGTSGSAATNLKSKIFSISFVWSKVQTYDRNPGEIIFGFNPLYAVPGAFQAFPASENWEIALDSAKISFGDKPITHSGRLIFDMNAKNMGFPLKIFQDLIQQFTTTTKINCDAKQERPFCKPYHNTTTLPNLDITFGEQTITIPPQAYSEYDSSLEGTFLTLQALTKNEDLTTGVTPSFVDAIILDPNFMSYYYTVFNRTSTPTVELYVRSNYREQTATEQPKGLNPLYFVGLGVIVVLALIIAFKIIAKRRADALNLELLDKRDLSDRNAF